jgi:hypothetical protein
LLALPQQEAEEFRMIRPVAQACVAIALFALTLTSCGGTDLAATPTPNPITETFTGSLAPGQKAIHPFAVTSPGSVYTTLTALSGPALIGLGIGTWDGTTCTVGAHSENAVVGSYIGASVPSPQNLCAIVYDVNVITTTATYTVTAVHP